MDSPKFLPAYDPADPLVTISLSSLRATHSSGVTWVAEQFPSVTLKSSEINNYVTVLNFVTPEGVKKYIEISFNTQAVAALTSQRKAPSNDVLNTFLALYKFDREFDVFASPRGVSEKSIMERIKITGNIVFQYETNLMTDSYLALNISKLFAAPDGGHSAKTFSLETAHERRLSADLFHRADVLCTILVTDGADVWSTVLDVKRLLNWSPEDLTGVITVATIDRVTTWILAAADEKGKVIGSSTRIPGHLNVSIVLSV
jgi:hypothetical protein